MIFLSYNEILSTTRKAAGGAGLPHGVAEELGHAAVWLAARGLDAVSIIVRALSDSGPQAILSGLAGIDALCCGETSKGLTLENEDICLVLIALAAIASENTGLVLASRRTDGSILSLEDACRKPEVDHLCLVLAERKFDVGTMPLTRPAATSPAAYAAALQLAAKTYVPASALSRAMGAGAGTTDND